MILLSAYACHPEKGSEPGVGWNWLVQISRFHQTIVLFYEGQGQKDAVESAIKLLPQRNNIILKPISVPKFFQNKFFRLRYEIWQVKAYFVARNFVKTQKIDLIHSVTIAAWWFTGYYYLLPTKFVWGPISGMQYVPFSALSFMRMQDRLFEVVRFIITRFGMNLSVSARLSFKIARIVFAANPISHKIFSNYNHNCVLFSEIGVTEVKTSKESAKALAVSKKEIRLLWAGLLIPSKNFGLLLDSLLLLPKDFNWFLTVAGGGKMLDYWKSKVNGTEIYHRVEFLGEVKYSEMDELYQKSDIFVFPSLREASGTVLLEAMSHALPIIAMHLNSAPELLSDECGITIPIINKKQMIIGFRDAIVNLSNDDSLRSIIGQNAMRKVSKQYLWEKRGELMYKYYRNIIF